MPHFKTRVFFPRAGSIAFLLAPPAEAIDISKTSNTDALNLGSSWNGGVGPSAIDVALFDSAITGPLVAPLGGDLAWQGIRVSNVAGGRNAANNVTIGNAGSANTLSLGSS